MMSRASVVDRVLMKRRIAKEGGDAKVVVMYG